MVQGPISRFNDLAPQLFARRSLDYTDLKYGIQLILWGYFKKMVIADRAAVLVNTVLDDPWSYSGSILAVGVLFYRIQLYGDFSGGIDITRGVARLFGIDLAENFRRPLFSTSLTDFWRRWHITLGAWMRDYLFYPLSLSKPFGKLGKFTRKHLKGKLGKILPTSLATFLVYFVIGIWHGANWRYVAFGFWNGGIITLSLLLAPYFLRWKQALRINDKSKGWHLFQLVRTNLLVFFGRYITRAPRFLTAVWMVKETFLHPNLPDLWNGTLMTLGLGGGDFLILFLGVATLLLAEWYQEKKGSHPSHAGTAVPLPAMGGHSGAAGGPVLLRRAAGRLHLLGFYLQAILTTGGSHGFQTMAGLFSGYGSVAGGCRGRVQLLGGPLWGLFP
ncbi:MAG: MBOAT family O-acyltransferase [Evtepia gabavorous]